MMRHGSLSPSSGDQGYRWNVEGRYGSDAYATVGVEILLPYWFDVEAALFLSEHGDTFARLEGGYDFQLMTPHRAGFAGLVLKAAPDRTLI